MEPLQSGLEGVRRMPSLAANWAFVVPAGRNSSRFDARGPEAGDSASLVPVQGGARVSDRKGAE